MPLTIYGIAASRAIRPLWAAEELGLDYVHVPLHYLGAEIQQPWYRALNPNGTVPAMDDHGLVLFESLAMTLHLARKHGQGRLWPADEGLQAQVLQWTLWAATEAEPPARQWFQHTQFFAPELRDPALAESGRRKALDKVLLLDRLLCERPYLLGEAFTVADLNVAAVLQRLPALAGEQAPHARQWHARCFERAAAQRALALRQVPAA